MMRIRFLLLAAVFGLATAANAATLTVVSDFPTYNVTDTITLTITGTPAGGTATNIIGDLSFGPEVTFLSEPVQTQATSFGGFIPWIVNGLQGTLLSGQVHVFDQIGGLGPIPIDQATLTFVVTFSADAPGTVNFNWDPGTLSFFGITGALAGTSITIVPEPGTLLLLGAGLGGLALVGRRR